MIPHVGTRNYPQFMKLLNSLLKDDGIIIIETTGNIVSSTRGDPWLDKYIFPGLQMPSLAQLSKPMEKFFILEDFHNFGPDYVKTLRQWNNNMEQSWDDLKSKGYIETQRKMFRIFFCVCAALFRSRAMQYWHLVLTKNKTWPQPDVRYQ